MILLDENILDGQRLLLEAWRVPVRQIGVDHGRKGLKDGQIIVELRRLQRPTFFTRDRGFFRRDVRHRGYAVVVLGVGQHDAATFVRRFLRHGGFDTQAKRMGKVIRLSPAGLAYWEIGRSAETYRHWIERDAT